MYDLAFLLEVDALSKGTEVPKYRTFSLWRAGYSLDGYGTTIDRWLDGAACDEDLDYVPSARIRQYLTGVRRSGTIPELRAFRGERYDRCLRLRSVRGLGPSKIALTVSSNSLDDEWFSQAAVNLALDRDRMAELFQRKTGGPWQTAHIVPPLLRFLNTVQRCQVDRLAWGLSGISDPFEPVNGLLSVVANSGLDSLSTAIERALRREKLFRRDSQQNGDGIRIRHQMGWSFVVQSDRGEFAPHSIPELANSLDPLASDSLGDLLSDLHLHTAWSDGSASVNAMATAVVASGLKYFAVTDHSRSCKLQGGLTPLLWLRQANALTLAAPVCPVLHGIEVDILKDGRLDLPDSLLEAADLVVASVHTNWTDDPRANTDRLLKAIESGYIDIIGHPTSALVGKPGVPDYLRTPADVHWDKVFEKCALWGVALEMNCFPSRLDLSCALLEKAVAAGCAIAIGSDAHARSHLINLRFGVAALHQIEAPVVLNRFEHHDLKRWIAESRAKRRSLTRTARGFVQAELSFEEFVPDMRFLRAQIEPPRNIPAGSRVVGLDLTAGDKATGVALLDDRRVETCSLTTDDEILAYIQTTRPGIVSIDSPLGLPGGGESINPAAGIVRIAEHDLASVGIPAYPALIDSMRELTLRGIRLRQAIHRLSGAPSVIESYPGAAQDILCIPRKQKSLDQLREGLRRLGLTGPGLETRSHDEMDAVTAAIVGRYFESGVFEPMGIPSEAQLIVPTVRPLCFEKNPVICLAGKTGAGKSVVARYLSVFYGFEWVRTRDVIRDLLLADLFAPPGERMFHGVVDPSNITEKDLRDFGAIVLNTYRQVPIRSRLTKIIKERAAPIVVDSIRDTADLDADALASRPVLIWFVDCSDTIIQRRLATRQKLGQNRMRDGSPVDRTADIIRLRADRTLPNYSSLEDLRWRVDDTLFGVMQITTF